MRSGTLRPGGRLPAVSEKRRDLNARRADMMVDIRDARRYCEAYALLKVAADGATGGERDKYLKAMRVCHFWAPRDGHEPLKRSRGGRIDDPANTLHVCRPCHEFTEAEVALSERAGLLFPSKPVKRLFWQRRSASKENTCSSE